MDEIHHFYGESNIHPGFPTTKQNQLEVARDSIVRSPNSMVRSPHTPWNQKLLRLKNNFKNFKILNQFFFIFIQILKNPMVRSSTRLPSVLGFLAEVDQLNFSWIVDLLPLQSGGCCLYLFMYVWSDELNFGNYTLKEAKLVKHTCCI